MTPTPAGESLLERGGRLLMFAAFCTAFACLASGLALWLAAPADTIAARLLIAGLLGLLGIPILNLLTIVAGSIRRRDWLTLVATLAVLTILVALTIRDAVQLRS